MEYTGAKLPREPINIPVMTEMNYKVDSPLVMMVIDRPMKWTVDVMIEKTSRGKM